MSTIKLEIKGNFLKITDNINDNDEILISGITKYFFSKNDTLLNLRTEQGTNQVTYKYLISTLVDSTDTPFASLVALEDFLSENLGGSSGGSGVASEGISIENTNVSGSYDIDWSLASNWELTLTAATTLTESNLPSVGFEKTITLYVSGDFAFTLPIGWVVVSGVYDGVNGSQIVVQVRNNTSIKYHTVINDVA